MAARSTLGPEQPPPAYDGGGWRAALSRRWLTPLARRLMRWSERLQASASGGPSSRWEPGKAQVSESSQAPESSQFPEPQARLHRAQPSAGPPEHWLAHIRQRRPELLPGLLADAADAAVSRLQAEPSSEHPVDGPVMPTDLPTSRVVDPMDGSRPSVAEGVGTVHHHGSETPTYAPRNWQLPSGEAGPAGSGSLATASTGRADVPASRATTDVSGESEGSASAAAAQAWFADASSARPSSASSSPQGFRADKVSPQEELPRGGNASAASGAIGRVDAYRSLARSSGRPQVPGTGSHFAPQVPGTGPKRPFPAASSEVSGTQSGSPSSLSSQVPGTSSSFFPQVPGTYAEAKPSSQAQVPGTFFEHRLGHRLQVPGTPAGPPPPEVPGTGEGRSPQVPGTSFRPSAWPLAGRDGGAIQGRFPTSRRSTAESQHRFVEHWVDGPSSTSDRWPKLPAGGGDLVTPGPVPANLRPSHRRRLQREQRGEPWNG